MTNRTLRGRCGGGVECPTGAWGHPGLGQRFQYVAYVGGAGGTMPPPPVIRTSDLLRICR